MPRIYPRAASMVLVLGLSSLLAADTPDKKPVAERLTHKSLLTMLEKLGYEAKAIGKAKTNYQVEVKVGDFVSRFDVSLSTDESRLWLVSNSNLLVDPKAIPRKTLLKLLAHNRELEPSFFTLDEKNRRVYFLFSIPNKDISSRLLGSMIERFGENIKKTWPDWNYQALQPPKPVVDGEAAAKERKKLNGAWTVHSFTSNGETKGADKYKGYVYTFKGTAGRHGNTTFKFMTIALDPEKDPGHIEFRTSLSEIQKGIYKFDDEDTLTVCIPDSNKPRPSKFDAPKGSACYLMVLKRQKP